MTREREYIDRQESPESQKAIQLLREIEAGPNLIDSTLSISKLERSFENLDKEMWKADYSNFEVECPYESEVELNRKLDAKIAERIHETYLCLDKLLGFIDDKKQGTFEWTPVPILEDNNVVGHYRAKSDPSKMTLEFEYDDERNLYIELDKGKAFGTKVEKLSINCRVAPKGPASEVSLSSTAENTIYGFLGGVISASVVHVANEAVNYSLYDSENLVPGLIIGSSVCIGAAYEFVKAKVSDYLRHRKMSFEFELKDLPKDQREKLLPIINSLSKYVENAVTENTKNQIEAAKQEQERNALEIKRRIQKAEYLEQLVS